MNPRAWMFVTLVSLFFLLQHSNVGADIAIEPADIACVPVVELTGAEAENLLPAHEIRDEHLIAQTRSNSPVYCNVECSRGTLTWVCPPNHDCFGNCVTMEGHCTPR